MSPSPSLANVALLGSGTFAKASYLPALLALQGSVLNLHTIWSRSSSSAESFLEAAKDLKLDSALSPQLKLRHGQEGWDAVLADKDVEGVMIVAPITAQPDMVRKAWKAGKHVISEKPLAKDVKDALELIEEYERDYKPKGLIWRIAENYAHEPILREAGKYLASTPDLGPILNWSLRFEAYVEDGSKYHKTGWRTIPDYQGGFLLDGGVHWTALLRTVLPASARPSSLISYSHLHRTHLLPHDTVTAISLPLKSSTSDSHGPKTKLTSAATSEADIPSEIGKSSPTGQILMSFAVPDIPAEKKLPNGLVITCLNGVVFVNSNAKNRNFEFEVIPSASSSASTSDSLKGYKNEGPMEGVQVELQMFAEAISTVKSGGTIKDEEEFAKPRDALWDLAVVQGMLQSQGKEISVDGLVGGQA